jgi:hypothetical protein
MKMYKKENTYVNSESHHSTIADNAPDGIRFSPLPNVLEFKDVSSSLPLFSAVESKRSRNPSTDEASDEKKLELNCAA